MLSSAPATTILPVIALQTQLWIYENKPSTQG